MSERDTSIFEWVETKQGEIGFQSWEREWQNIVREREAREGYE